MHPTVSVVLPTFNRPKSLSAAMQSVLEQSFCDLELIVVDDASTEDIKSVVNGFDDSRVRYLKRRANGGAAAARNTGVAQATGRYLAFQDSDDLWLPGKLERQIALLEGQPREVGAVTGAKILYGRNDNYEYGIGKVAYAPAAGRWLSLTEDQLRRSLLENRISLQNALFRRECLPPEPLFDAAARANEDWGFTVRLVQVTKIYEDPEPVVFSYILSGSISQNSRRSLMGTIRILQNNQAVYRRYPKEHSRMLYKIGVSLWAVGRRKLARRVIRRSIQINPFTSILLVDSALKKIIARMRKTIPGGDRLHDNCRPQ